MQEWHLTFAAHIASTRTCPQSVRSRLQAQNWLPSSWRFRPTRCCSSCPMAGTPGRRRRACWALPPASLRRQARPSARPRWCVSCHGAQMCATSCTGCLGFRSWFRHGLADDEARPRRYCMASTMPVFVISNACQHLQAPGFHDYVSSDAELWQAPLQRPAPPPQPPLPAPSSFDSPQPSPRWPAALMLAMFACHRLTSCLSLHK